MTTFSEVERDGIMSELQTPPPSQIQTYTKAYNLYMKLFSCTLYQACLYGLKIQKAVEKVSKRKSNCLIHIVIIFRAKSCNFFICVATGVFRMDPLPRYLFFIQSILHKLNTPPHSKRHAGRLIYRPT